MKLYRIVSAGTPRTAWLSSSAAAMEEAQALGLASYDRQRREWYLAVPVEMETMEADGFVFPPDGGAAG